MSAARRPDDFAGALRYAIAQAEISPHVDGRATNWLASMPADQHTRSTEAATVEPTGALAEGFDAAAAQAERLEAIKARMDGSGSEAVSRWHTPSSLATMPAQVWLVAGVIPAETVGLIVGRDGTFKTFAALDLVLCVASGIAWHGRPVTPGRVMFLAGEGIRSFHARTSSWCEHHGIPLADIENRVLVRDGAVNVFETGPAWSDLLLAIDEFKPSIIVMDTLARSVAGAEQNSASDMSVVIARLNELRHLDTAVLLVAHTDKADRDARGSSAIEDNADYVLHARRSDAGLKLVVTKQKDGEDGAVIELHPRKLGSSLVLADGADVNSLRLANGTIGEQIVQALTNAHDADEWLTTVKVLAGVNEVRAALKLAPTTEDNVRKELGRLRTERRVTRGGSAARATWALGGSDV